MRNTLFTSLFLASATLASASSRLECLQTRGRDLASTASCGDEGSLAYCFSQLAESTQSEGTLAEDLERCFHNAGCTPAESHIEAFWLLRRCDTPSNSNNDLRRAAAARRDTHDHPHPQAAAKEPSFMGVTARAALPLPTPAAMAMTVHVHHPRQDTTASPASPTPCFTDQTSSITSCPVQSTGTDKGKKLSCFPTVTVSAVCRDGLICQQDNQGNPSCMYKQSSLDVGGTIIAIIMASAVLGSVISVCFCCCRERRTHKRIERAAEAAKIAKEAKTQAVVAAKRPGTAVTGTANAPQAAAEGQPLMYSHAPPLQQQGNVQTADVGMMEVGGVGAPGAEHGQFNNTPYHQQQQQLPQGAGGGGQYPGANPFADSHDAHPLR
jgi:hypothetical protein